MWSIARLRSHPHFARAFAHVHPLCWLILWWQLNRLLRWFETCRPEDVFYTVNRWGGVTIRLVSDMPGPATYRPLPRTFRPLTDESWSSDVPANLAANESLRLFPILPRCTGEVSPKVTEGALFALTPDTS